MSGDAYREVRERADLRQFAAEHLTPMGGTFVCPVCHSGTGPNRSPAFSIMPDGRRWKCFVCDKAGDVFDLYGILNETEDKREQLEGVARWAGIRLDTAPSVGGAFGWDDEVPTADAPKPAKEGGAQSEDGAGEREAGGIPLYWKEREALEAAAAVEPARRREAAYVEGCRASIGHPDAVEYMRARGIPSDMAERYGFGYDPRKRRLIVPWPGTGWYYTGRDVTGTAGNKYSVPSGAVGRGPIWGADALEGPVAFVVEGQFDAIAVAECGGRAVCTNGTKDLKRAAEAAARHPRCFLYLMFDADEKGRKECDSFLLELERLGAYSFGSVEVMECPYPDPWDWYAADPDGMRAAIARAIDAVPDDGSRFEAFADSLAPEGGDVAEWLDGSEPLPTGIRSLDAALGGGLYCGLHVLAAPPGAGKSSLAIQVSYNAAMNGHGVLYISLEMPRADVVARCAAIASMRSGNGPITFPEIEREGARLAREAGRDERRARGLAGPGTPAARVVNLLDALGLTVLKRLAIADGRDGGLADVAGVVALMERAARAGCALVVVDYMQFVDAGGASRADDKAERDGYVAKRLTEAAKRLNLRVLALSSMTKSESAKRIEEADPFTAKGSSDIGHDAVTVMRLSHDPDRLAMGNTVLTVKVAKNRKGESGGMVQLAFWAGSACVEDMGNLGPVPDA